MKASFKVLYSNDLTNILSCISPYHSKGEKFTRTMLDASIDETADTGVDVHMLQPGFSWVPMWQSKILPPSEHWNWLQNTYNKTEPDSFLEYLLEGGDIVADFTKRCREKNLVPFVSFRMNDTHHLDSVNKQNIGGGQISVCKFYHEHPEYRLETAANSWRDRGQNWAIAEVREYKYNFIQELCNNYDIDGFELDFMRAPYLFRLFETTTEQREQIITDFIVRIRKLLDETACEEQHRWLSVRIPANSVMLDSLGLNIARLENIGVDIFNLSHSFYSVQTGDWALFRQQAKNSAIYLEMTNCVSVGRPVEKADGDTFEFIKTSPEQFYTTALSAYNTGLDGVSLFNFVYYREHGSVLKKDTTGEPPFKNVKNFADREFLSRQNSSYFIGSHWEDDGPLPKAMMLLGQYASFTIKNVSSKGTVSAELRIYIDNVNCGDWEAWFNERPVNIKKYLERDKSNGKILVWNIPPEIIVEGDNNILFRNKDTELSVIDFIELKTWR